MSLLNMNFDGDYSAELIPEGENLVRISSAELQGEGSEYPRVQVILNSVDNPDAYPIFHALFLPNGDDGDDSNRQKNERMQKFLEAFNLPLKKPDTTQWPGAEAFAIVKHKNSDEYGIQANARRFIPKQK